MRAWNLIVGLTCLWLTACSPQDELTDHFQTYLTRVAYVLEVPAPPLSPPPALAPLPAQRELTLMPARISSGLLDALKLSQCDLLGLVAEHNGPAGKSLSAAGQFAYHLQFQRGLALCVTHIDDAQLHVWLTELAQLKAPLLPIYFWNMMVAEPEVRTALSPVQHSLAFNSQGGYQATLQAFSLFTHLQTQANQYAIRPLALSNIRSENRSKYRPVDINEEVSEELSEELNQALRGLYKNPYFGQLVYSLHASAEHLEQSIDFLGQLSHFNCQGANAIKAERLRNALQHYYIKDIQPYFTELDRQFVQLAPLLQASLTPPAEKADVMADYQKQLALGLESQLYVRYRTLTLQHAKVWQDFLKRCELSPKRG
ncbi:DUF3080 family protein [Oceanisphaera sp. IT1-181]|uniref:DUF3080 family protein n=1 Tax=Oceanisphaera sp. IT1-181 TaxID=3081199 RepID=UPI0029C9E01F|nr:DUF3080 family protein [Oceanisphaera sp. IT1-181]